jgi:hypothetical protein
LADRNILLLRIGRLCDNGTSSCYSLASIVVSSLLTTVTIVLIVRHLFIAASLSPLLLKHLLTSTLTSSHQSTEGAQAEEQGHPNHSIHPTSGRKITTSIVTVVPAIALVSASFRVINIIAVAVSI